MLTISTHQMATTLSVRLAIASLGVSLLPLHRSIDASLSFLGLAARERQDKRRKGARFREKGIDRLCSVFAAHRGARSPIGHGFAFSLFPRRGGCS